MTLLIIIVLVSTHVGIVFATIYTYPLILTVTCLVDQYHAACLQSAPRNGVAVLSAFLPSQLTSWFGIFIVAMRVIFSSLTVQFHSHVAVILTGVIYH